MFKELDWYAPRSTWTENDYKACAHSLGYDPNKIFVFKNLAELRDSRKHDPEWVEAFRVASAAVADYGKEQRTHMLTDTRDNDIYVFLEDIQAGTERSGLAHEIFHACFYSVMRAWADDNGKLKERFKDSLGDPVNLLRTGRDMCDITDYCLHYWQLVFREVARWAVTGEGKPNLEAINFPLVVTETLSEMARVFEMTGELPGNKVWKKFYRDIEQTAIELGVINR